MEDNEFKRLRKSESNMEDKKKRSVPGGLCV